MDKRFISDDKITFALAEGYLIDEIYQAVLLNLKWPKLNFIFIVYQYGTGSGKFITLSSTVIHNDSPKMSLKRNQIISKG